MTKDRRINKNPVEQIRVAHGVTLDQVSEPRLWIGPNSNTS